MARYREWKEAVQQHTPVEHQMEGMNFSKGRGLTWQTWVDLKHRNWAKRSPNHESRTTSQASEEEENSVKSRRQIKQSYSSNLTTIHVCKNIIMDLKKGSLCRVELLADRLKIVRLVGNF